jgi:hypothetical protein
MRLIASSGCLPRIVHVWDIRLRLGGLEKPLDQLKPWSEDKVCTYPMVWRHPVTGEDSLQVHGQGLFKLFLKSSPEVEDTVISNLGEVRTFMHK